MEARDRQTDRISRGRGFGIDFPPPPAPFYGPGEDGPNEDLIDIVAVVAAIVIVTLIALAC